MSSLDSILDSKPDAAKEEELEFILHKERIEEAFEELLYDLGAFARVVPLLSNQSKGEETVWKELLEFANDLKNYPRLQQILRNLDKITKDGTDRSADDPVMLIIRETIRNVRDVNEESLLRPPSPEITIKNRAEHETFSWNRMVALQESKLNKIQLQIEEYERKALNIIARRQRLRQRSASEKESQLNDFQSVLVDMRLEGDASIQRLKDELASKPPFENLPDYRFLMDKHELKKKRIAKMEVQLQLWVKKYDKFIGEPMASLMALEEKIGGLKEWQDSVFRPQEERLHQLQAQIGVFEGIATEEKVEQMRKLHAVRVLQRAWKRTLEIKRAKKGKKPKKGKGNK